MTIQLKLRVIKELQLVTVNNDDLTTTTYN